MNYFHVHVVVEDLTANIRFYSTLFGRAPSKRRDDYAKWVLEDPRVNFAISSRGQAVGVNHFGIQAGSQAELDDLKVRVDAASNGTTLDQDNTTCCYANSNKHWLVDPQGLAWEYFHSLAESDSFGDDTIMPTDSACCIPFFTGRDNSSTDEQSCCLPNEDKVADTTSCCGQDPARARQ